MPLYKFVCKKNHATTQFIPLAEYKEYIKCRCGRRAGISISDNLLVHSFKPYVEEHFDRNPIHVENKAQRDALCAQHGVTYDTNKYHKRKGYRAAIEDIEYDTVKHALETGRTPDGEKLEEPVKVSKKELERCRKL